MDAGEKKTALTREYGTNRETLRDTEDKGWVKCKREGLQNARKTLFSGKTWGGGMLKTHYIDSGRSGKKVLCSGVFNLRH